NNPIPADRARWGRFEELNEKNLKIERGILEQAAVPNPSRSPVDREIGDFYASCIDDAAIDAKGASPIEPLLDSIQKIQSKDALAAELASLDRAGVRALFSFAIRPDAKNANDQIADIDQGGLSLPDRDYYLKNDPHNVELRRKLADHVRIMFELLAAARKSSDPSAPLKADTVLKIETALAKASMDRAARRDPDATYHKMTVDQVAALAPRFDWKGYFSGLGLPPIRDLNNGNPDFIKALNTEIGSTDLGDLKIYLEWHVLRAKAALLSTPFRNADFDFFEKTLRGVREQSARWKQCVGAADRALGEALGQKFVEVAFSPASKARAQEIVSEIERQMGDDIRSASWMTPATRDQALTKLRQVTNKIGYPDRWRDYSSVEIARGDFYGNSLRVTQFEIQRQLARLGKPVDKTEWNMTPPTVNAYYSPAQNNINFPAGILQPPFYNPKASDAVNYGAIAVVIGHELTHGFDDQGRRYDGEGNLRDWWTASDAKAFEERADCIAKEYGNFSPVEGVKLNGKLTLGENAADNGGMHLAYMALMDSLAGKILPKLDGFTPEQQFFLGYAQLWCQNVSDAAARMNAVTDPHSPGEFRVNGVVQNMPEFQKAFSCKIGDAMVAKDPCRVW
ncbi:MAG: M13 family metallopeptidase, partial [Bryobacteraceae bacterium]